MNHRTRCTDGHIIPANVADKIEEAALKFAPDVRDAFIAGAERGFRSEPLILTSHTAEVRAWKDGLRLGAWLRTERRMRAAAAEVAADFNRGIGHALREYSRRVGA